MAGGAEIITLDSDDEADSSNVVPDEQTSTMAFDPANYADLMSRMSQSRLMAPLMLSLIHI